jgi:hypothetical protein
VAIGDVDHDGFRDIILAPGGSGNGQNLIIISGRNLLTEFKINAPLVQNGVNNGFPNLYTTTEPQGLGLPATSVAPLNANLGIHVATADLNNDGFGDILLSGGAGSPSIIVPFITNLGGTTTQGAFANVFAGTLGVFVGGGPV